MGTKDCSTRNVNNEEKDEESNSFYNASIAMFGLWDKQGEG